jgi:hypothetical protein
MNACELHTKLCLALPSLTKAPRHTKELPKDSDDMSVLIKCLVVK